jgi:iron complex transport system ATP-binding protein
VIDLRGVCVDRGQRRTVDTVDLHVAAGEVVALVGPNGAGKSTLLAAAAGDVACAAGTIRLADRDVTSTHQRDLARVRAVMPQASAVSFPFTVGEVVRMGRAPWRGGQPGTSDDDAITDAMQIADVAHLVARPMTALSGGEQQRVALARCLAQRTPILLLDEPTAALDLQHQVVVGGALAARAADGAAVLVVVHDLSWAAAVADRIVIMAAGKVVADASPTRALTPERIAEVYGQPVEVVRTPSGAMAVVPAHRVRGESRARG